MYDQNYKRKHNNRTSKLNFADHIHDQCIRISISIPNEIHLTMLHGLRRKEYDKYIHCNILTLNNYVLFLGKTI